MTKFKIVHRILFNFRGVARVGGGLRAWAPVRSPSPPEPLNKMTLCTLVRRATILSPSQPPTPLGAPLPPSSGYMPIFLHKLQMHISFAKFIYLTHKSCPFPRPFKILMPVVLPLAEKPWTNFVTCNICNIVPRFSVALTKKKKNL